MKTSMTPNYGRSSLRKCMLYWDAYALITDETVELMRDHDADVLRKIAALHNRIAEYSVIADSPADVLSIIMFDEDIVPGHLVLAGTK